MFLILFDPCLEVIERYLFIFDDHVELKLLDTKANCDEFGATPNEAILFDCEDILFQCLHICLVICMQSAKLPKKRIPI